MKCIFAFPPIATVCLSAILLTTALPAQAQWSRNRHIPEESATEQISEDTESREIILLESLPTQLLTEDANILNRLAEQINQDMGERPEGFLPAGMVVRGSNSSLQVGSEL